MHILQGAVTSVAVEKARQCHSTGSHGLRGILRQMACAWTIFCFDNWRCSQSSEVSLSHFISQPNSLLVQIMKPAYSFLSAQYLGELCFNWNTWVCSPPQSVFHLNLHISAHNLALIPTGGSPSLKQFYLFSLAISDEIYFKIPPQKSTFPWNFGSNYHIFLLLKPSLLAQS